MYLINTIVGPLMPIVFIIIGIFRGSDEIKIYLSLMDSQQVLLPILLASMMFTSSLCMITSSSISLEGKNLGTLKSYPLSVPEIFLAKILLQVVISVLGSAAAIVLGVIFYDLSWTYALVLLVSAIIFAVFGACFGLIINLLFPRLEWDSETIVVKQSMAVLITTFGGLAIGGLQILAYIMVIKYLSLPVFIILDLILNMILIYGMWLYLSTAGVKKFREL
ncbi:hypothetical protein SDC9_176850 [bioreactor metagenome]|uniref:Uncharacterized protein n=1 Tax=bioreactor metagenome TaxID=1076179 RepID=A0A645GR71_9ZZZZ